MRLVEAEITVQRMLRLVDRAHHHADVLRCGDMRVVGEADGRRILQRHPRARVDRLGLREHEGRLLVRGLRRRQPLQAAGIGRGGVDDAYLRRVLRRGNRELAAQFLVARRQRVFERGGLARGIERADRGDLQVARVQHQRRCRRALPVQLERGDAVELLVREVDLQVEVEMRHDHLIGLGVRVGIVGLGGERQQQRAEGEDREQAHGRGTLEAETPSMPLQQLPPPVTKAPGQGNSCTEYGSIA